MFRVIFIKVTRISMIGIFITLVFFCPRLIASGTADNAEKTEMSERSQRIQVAFVENKGVIEDKEVAFFAALSHATVYIYKNGTLTYNFLPEGENSTSFNEIFTPQKITLIPLEPPPADIVALYKQKGYMKGDYTQYYRMSLGEIYPGVELELTAFTETLEKLLTLSPQGHPETVKIKIEGCKGLKVDKYGMLEIVTDRSSEKFTKPYAFQETDDGGKTIEVSYSILKDSTYGFKVGKYDKSKPLKIRINLFKGGNR